MSNPNHLGKGGQTIKESLKKLLGLVIFGQVFLVGAVLENKEYTGETPVISGSKSSYTMKSAGVIESDKPPKSVLVQKPKPLPPPESTVLGIMQHEENLVNLIDFDFSKPISMRRENHEGKLLRLRITPGLAAFSEGTTSELCKIFQKFSHHRAPNYSELIFFGFGAVGDPLLATSPTGLCRLTIPFRNGESVFPLLSGEEIEKGLFYYQDRPSTKSGPSDVFILRLEPFTNSLAIFPVLANEGICQKEILSSMGRRYKAVAGINGAYFTNRGDPIGTLIINRRLISSPLYNRSVFGIANYGNYFFGNPDFSGNLTAKDISLDINAVNQPRHDDQIVIYTPEFARSTLTSEDGLELVLVKERVVGIHQSDALIPPDGVVVSAGGKKARTLSKVKLGDLVKLDYQVTPPWNNILHAVCGGPKLIVNGEIEVNGKQEKFDPGLVNGRHPRSAIALTASGDLLLVVIDGRSSRSSGMTLHELAAYLKKLGAKEAINLDGGGSSSLFIHGKTVNRPSDGKERPISNGILITQK